MVYAQSYDKLWKQVEQAEKKSLPQTVVSLADEIYRKGLREHNAGQMLKAYVCRTTYREDLTPDSCYTRLPQMEQWARTEKDGVTRAILYSLLAEDYADLARSNRFALRARTEVDDDTPGDDIRLWTASQFVRRIDDCCMEALRDSVVLLEASAEDYVPFVELEDGSRFYGHDLYHLLSRRAIEAYQGVKTYADSLVERRVEGIYRNLMDAYRQRPGREDALLLSTLAYWENNDQRYRVVGDENRSGEAYLKALECDPGQAETWVAIGCLYVEFGDYRAALSAFESAYRLDPEVERIHLFLAIAHFKLGDMEVAADHLHQAVEKEKETLDIFREICPEAKINKL